MTAKFLAICTFIIAVAAQNTTSQTTGGIGSWLDSYPFPQYKSPYSGLDALPSAIRESLPLPALNLSPDQIDFAQLQPYAIRVGAASGTGFILAILSLVTALVYLPIRLCCACCNKKKPPKVQKPKKTVILLAILVGAGISTVVACSSGFVGNSGFTKTLRGLSSGVLGAAQDVVDLISEIGDFIQGLPSTITTFLGELQATLSIVPKLFDTAEILRQDIANVSTLLWELDAELQAINESYRPEPFATQVHNLAQQSNDTLDQMTQLTTMTGSGFLAQLANGSLLGGMNFSDTLGGFSGMFDSVLSMIQTYSGYGEQYSAMALGYDKYRLGAYNALFAVPFLAMVLVGVAAFFKQSWLFHVTVTLAFLMLFFMFLLGAVHLVLAIVLGDACVASRSIAVPSLAVDVLTGCQANQSAIDILGFGEQLSQLQFLDISSLANSTDYISSGFNASTIDKYILDTATLNQYRNISSRVDPVVSATLRADADFDVMSGILNNMTGVAIPRLQTQIEDFASGLLTSVFDLTKCLFVPDAFASAYQQICTEFVAALDVLWISCFIIAFGTIPLIVVESLLIRHFKNPNPEDPALSEIPGTASTRQNAVHPETIDVRVSRDGTTPAPAPAAERP